MNTFIYILLAVLGFGLIIGFHEFGHYIWAKMTGVTVTKFHIGFGPYLWRYIGKDDVEYSLRLIPFGGCCSLLYEDAKDEYELKARGSFGAASTWKKFMITAGGCLNNFILGFLILVIIYMIQGVSLTNAVVGAATLVYTIIQLLVQIIAGLVTGDIALSNLGGTVSCVQFMVEESAALGTSFMTGFLTMAIMIAFMSINVGFVNLLPIPAMDGSRLWFIAINGILKFFKTRIPAGFELKYNTVGLKLLLVSIGILTVKDIAGIITAYILPMI